jgi:hypothetical protein
MPASRLGLQSLTAEGLPEPVMLALNPEGIGDLPKSSTFRLKAVFSAPNGLVELASHPL